jgi:nicotinate-nucleotide pyrophosphorylase (carboxylating)
VSLGTEEVRAALEEDRAREDVTTALLGPAAHRPATGTFRAEEPFVVAGLPVVREVFGQLEGGARLEPCRSDGESVLPGDPIAVAEASAATLLAGERVALNFLQRLSAISTLTRRAVDAVRGTGCTITDTRKTTPGLRALEKYAVRVGGGENHRFSLADGVLWKDNHWPLLRAGGETLEQALRKVPPGLDVIVEVESDEQLELALAAGVGRILVDNQPPERVAEWAGRCAGRAVIEASGGITPETAAAYARAGARYISIGALTHSAGAVKISFEVELSG